MATPGSFLPAAMASRATSSRSRIQLVRPTALLSCSHSRAMLCQHPEPWGHHREEVQAGQDMLSGTCVRTHAQSPFCFGLLHADYCIEQSGAARSPAFLEGCR